MYADFMTILSNTIEAKASGAHCWVTIQQGHEEAFQALVNTVAAGGQFQYTPVGEIRILGLSDVQQAELVQGREDLIYKHGSVFVLQDLWHEVEEAFAQAAPNAIIQHRIAVNLSFVAPYMIDKLRTELSVHPSLNNVEIEFGED